MVCVNLQIHSLYYRITNIVITHKFKKSDKAELFLCPILQRQCKKLNSFIMVITTHEMKGFSQCNCFWTASLQLGTGHYVDGGWGATKQEGTAHEVLPLHKWEGGEGGKRLRHAEWGGAQSFGVVFTQ